MEIEENVLRELEIYATRVGMHDPESLARFHQECTPERILALIEELRELKVDYTDVDELWYTITGLEADLEELEFERDSLEEKVSELQEELDEYR